MTRPGKNNSKITVTQKLLVALFVAQFTALLFIVIQWIVIYDKISGMSAYFWSGSYSLSLLSIKASYNTAEGAVPIQIPTVWLLAVIILLAISIVVGIAAIKASAKKSGHQE